MKRSYAAMTAEEVATPDRVRHFSPGFDRGSIDYEATDNDDQAGTAPMPLHAAAGASPSASASLSQLSFNFSNANLGAPMRHPSVRANAFQKLRNAQRRQLFDEDAPAAKRLRPTLATEPSDENETGSKDSSSSLFKPSRSPARFAASYVAARLGQSASAQAPSVPALAEGEQKSTDAPSTDVKSKHSHTLLSGQRRSADSAAGGMMDDAALSAGGTFGGECGSCACCRARSSSGGDASPGPAGAKSQHSGARMYSEREVQALIRDALEARDEETSAETYREMKRLLKEQFDAFTHFHTQYVNRNVKGDNSYFS